MMSHHQEMEEQFKKEREEWEREQASKLHERLQARVVNPSFLINKIDLRNICVFGLGSNFIFGVNKYKGQISNS